MSRRRGFSRALGALRTVWLPRETLILQASSLSQGVRMGTCSADRDSRYENVCPSGLYYRKKDKDKRNEMKRRDEEIDDGVRTQTTRTARYANKNKGSGQYCNTTQNRALARVSLVVATKNQNIQVLTTPPGNATLPQCPCRFDGPFLGTLPHWLYRDAQYRSQPVIQTVSYCRQDRDCRVRDGHPGVCVSFCVTAQQPAVESLQ